MILGLVWYPEDPDLDYGTDLGLPAISLVARVLRGTPDYEQVIQTASVKTPFQF